MGFWVSKDSLNTVLIRWFCSLWTFNCRHSSVYGKTHLLGRGSLTWGLRTP